MASAAVAVEIEFENAFTLELCTVCDSPLAPDGTSWLCAPCRAEPTPYEEEY